MKFLIVYFQYEIDIPKPGNYTIQAEATNAVSSEHYISDAIQIYVADLIDDVFLSINGKMVGDFTVIEIDVHTEDFFYLEIGINYGDGESEFFFAHDVVAMLTSDQTIRVLHCYNTGGDFNITVNASTRVGSHFVWEVFTPIVNLSLKSLSPWKLPSTGHVVVKATVEGGRNLTFDWNFSDQYAEPTIQR